MTDEELERLKQVKIGIPFMDFINQCTNLITVFAIFNALLVYALSLKTAEAGASYNLALAFYGISLLVWVQIIVFAIKSNDQSFYYNVFLLFAAAVQFELTLLYIKQNALFFSMMGLMIVYLAVIFGNAYLFHWLFRRWIRRLTAKKQRNVLGILIILSCIGVGIVAHFTGPYVRPHTSKIIDKLMPIPADSTIVE